MRLLLDTHIALWAITDDTRLATRARDLIVDPRNVVLVSSASVWEIAIKHSLARTGAGAMPISGSEALEYFRHSGFGLLAISADHAAAVEALPPLHADPFDRMLVVQAQLEPLRLITHDAKVAAYSDAVLLV